jgi:hypothetical protein
MQSSEEMVKEKSESFRKNLATTQRKQDRHSGKCRKKKVSLTLLLLWHGKIVSSAVALWALRMVQALKNSERFLEDMSVYLLPGVPKEGGVPQKTPLFLRDTSPHPSLLTLLQLDMEAIPRAARQIMR